MTDQQNKAANQAYDSGDIKRKARTKNPDGRSKYDSMTSWGPPRRKKRGAQGKSEKP